MGEILEKYNHTKMFPCYGFGAKLPDGKVPHCSALLQLTKLGPQTSLN